MFYCVLWQLVWNAGICQKKKEEEISNNSGQFTKENGCCEIFEGPLDQEFLEMLCQISQPGQPKKQKALQYFQFSSHLKQSRSV